jgi:hypothetical protein
MGRLVNCESKKKTLEGIGFSFVDSRMVTLKQGKPDERHVYAADIQPNSVISCYSEYDSVLELPWRLSQGEAYGDYVPNLSLGLQQGTLMQLTLKERQPVLEPIDLNLLVSPKPGVSDLGELQGTELLGTLLFSFKDCKWPLEYDMTQPVILPVLLARFEELDENHLKPYIRVSFDGELTLLQVQEFARLLQQIDVDEGVYIEAPPTEQLYYDFLLPEDAWRDPEERIASPWGVRLRPEDEGGNVARLIKTDWSQPEPVQNTREFELPDMSKLTELLKQHKPEVRGLFVFAPGAMLYGDLMAAIKDVPMEFYPLYVFVD